MYTPNQIRDNFAESVQSQLYSELFGVQPLQTPGIC